MSPPVELAHTCQGAGDSVLLLHGQGARGADFEHQIADLSATHQVIAPDLRGHGDSPAPSGPYSMPLLTADVAALVERLQLAPCHVVGHSLGGCVALQLAVDSPALVRTLTVINATACMVPQGLVARLQNLLLRLSLRVTGVGPVARASARMHFPDPEQQPLRERLIARMTATSVAGYRGAQAAVDRFDVRARLADITCPVLVIAGDDDPLPLADKRALAAGVARGRLEILARSRHVSIWDQPHALGALLREFLTAGAVA